MKVIRKLAVILLTCYITVHFISLSVFADVRGKLEISNATASAGDTIDIHVILSDNPGFISANLYVKYDESVLTLEKVTDGKLITGVAHSDNYSSPYGLCWMNDLATENIKVNGVLATLTFKVKDTNKTETSLSVEQDVVDYKISSVVFEVSGGKIKLNSEIRPKQSSQLESSDVQAKDKEDHSPAQKQDNNNSNSSQSNGGLTNSFDKESGETLNQDVQNGTGSDLSISKSDSLKSIVANSQDDYTSNQSETFIQRAKLSTADTAKTVDSDNNGFPYWIIILIVVFAAIGAIAFIMIKKKSNNSKTNAEEQ